VSGRRFALILAILLALHAASRLYGLMRLPVFLDEAIHVEWAFKARAAGGVLGVTDGSRYLPISLYASVLPAADDPLRAARLVSVAGGAVGLAALAGLGAVLYDRRVGLAAGALYVALPFTLVYDRMALVDGLLTTLTVSALLFGALWARSGCWHWALLAGAAAGASAATKLYGILVVASTGACVLAMSAGPRSRSRRRALLRQSPLFVAAVLAFLVPVLRDFASTRRFIAENLWVFRTDPEASFSLAENLWLGLVWPADYLTPPGFAVGLVALAAALRAGPAVDRLLASLVLGWWFFFVLAGGRDWFPRYLLPAVPSLLLLVAARASRLARASDTARHVPRRLAWCVGVLWAGWCLWFGHAVVTDPARAPLPDADRWQYVYDWPSGYGLAELAAFLRAEGRRAGPIAVVRPEASGPLLEGLNLLLRADHAHVRLYQRSFGDGIAPPLPAGERVVFTVCDLAAGDELPLRGQASPVASYPKPDGRRRLVVLRLRPAPDPAQGVVVGESQAAQPIADSVPRQ
jgi:hypothetical protein